MLTFSIFVIFINLLLPVSLQPNCTFLRNNFANSVSEFTACAINNSRPVTFCENCVHSFIAVIENYGNMTQLVDNQTQCIDQLINLDRLQIVETLYKSSYNLWNDAKCSQCFEVVDGQLTPTKSAQANNFTIYYQNLNKCVNQTAGNDSVICSTCMEDYIVLNNYYSSIVNVNEDIGGCMDIVDAMNTTQSLWSQKCCKYRRHDEYIFIASTIAVLILTLCFYVVVQFCSVKTAPAILQQTRFAESLSQTIH